MTYYVSSGTLNPTHSLTHRVVGLQTYNAICIFVLLSRSVNYKVYCSLVSLKDLVFTDVV